jgi:hypothetical protein
MFDPLFDQPDISGITSKEAYSHSYLHHKPEYRSSGFACHVVPNMTNATIAIHPNRPISKAVSESVSALIESTKPSLNDTLRISDIARRMAYYFYY